MQPPSETLIPSLTFTDKPLSGYWGRVPLPFTGKDLQLLQLLATNQTADYATIYVPIWNEHLHEEPTKKRRGQLNKIHQVVKNLRAVLGHKSITLTDGTYQLHPDRISIKPASTAPSQHHQRQLSTGQSITDAAIGDVLYHPKAERERTILRGNDPLRTLLREIPRFLKSMESKRTYWIITNNLASTIQSLGDLAKSLRTEEQLRFVTDHLRLLIVDEDIDDLSVILEGRQQRFIFADDLRTALVQATGPDMLQTLNLRLGAYGVQHRGPVLRDLRGQGKDEASALEARFRSACALLAPDKIDDCVSAWFSPTPTLIPVQATPERSVTRAQKGNS